MTGRPTPSPRYIAVLAFVSALILAAGAYFRPVPDATTTAAPPPTETDLLRLTRLAQRRSLDNMTSYFAYVADDAARSLHHLPGADLTAVAWSDRLLVAPGSMPARLGAPLPVGGDGGVQATVAMWGPRLPIVVLEMPQGHPVTPLPRSGAPLQPGEWLTTVWQTASGRAFAPGTFLESAPVTCEEIPAIEISTSMTFTGAMSGGVVTNADGLLVGVILPCNGRLSAVRAGDVDAMLDVGRTRDGRILAAWGFRADRATLDEAAFFKTSGGVIVREVWTGLPADRAGLRPGDLLVSIDAQPVDTLDALDALVTAGQPTLAVRRGSATATIELAPDAAATPAETTDAAPPLGLVWDAPQPGYRIESIVPGSAAERAGIRPGDLLLRINHVEPKDMAQVRKLLAAGRSTAAFVELQRGQRRWGVLLL